MTEIKKTTQDVVKEQSVDTKLGDGIRGELTFHDKVIEKIVALALKDVPGLLGVSGGFFSNFTGKLVNTDNSTDGIEVEVGKKQVAVDLDVVAEFGKDVNEIFEAIKKTVSEKVAKMTGLEVVEVNVNVVDVKSREQYKEEQVTVQDRVSDAAQSTGQYVSEKTEEASDKLSKEADKLKDKNTSRVK
ncbi:MULTISPECIES: Asp23/Gls24 family envelope stress response protein [Facklamia]|uniref:Stress response regulator gls24 homolog n=1 Tax=Facklamia hominis TaxID=178214 RepID=A0AAJ1Q4J3_9LACT|nr:MULTISPECIES: Asp23/Gls24 family envelope stress response protein [Facklamia]MDK7187538.1 Asp23/Gls24 family envelope stress response protein [Facklamia hominis]OFL65811.1 stress response regulator Gls24 [Facklamia sp. HMSC062C11]